MDMETVEFESNVSVHDAELDMQNSEIKEEVVAAYNEILRKLTGPKSSEPIDNDAFMMEAELAQAREVIKQQEDIVMHEKEDSLKVISTASRETADELIKTLGDVKHLVAKSLDELKNRLLPEYEKYNMIRTAIELSEKELASLHKITANANTLRALMLTQKEQTARFERDMAERSRHFNAEKQRLEQEWHKEQMDYNARLNASRKSDAEQYDNMKRELHADLNQQRLLFEDECETREARLSAREADHQQMREREAWIMAREQEYQQFKERAAAAPEELRVAMQKIERTITEQLTRKYEYDAKLMQIEMQSERTMTAQKISSLEDQINQYRSLRQVFDQLEVDA